jgi:glycosyltransferase involved in cell wall biosynthesis
MLATLATWKGHALFLEAVASLTDLPARFYLVTGALYSTEASQGSIEALRSKAAALGLEGRCGFIAFQADPAPIYSALDVVVHASISPEPFGRVVAEAMASGKSVLAAATGGVLEQVTSEQTGLTYPAGDRSALTAGLRRLIGDQALRTSLGDRARAHAVRNLDALRMGTEVRELYSQWTDEQPRASGD